MEAGTTQVVDATVVEDDNAAPDAGPEPSPTTAPTTALELHAGAQGGQIIQAEEPGEIIAKATSIATALKDLIDRQDLAKNLGGNRKHVEVGGWQACGTLLGALGGQPLHAETVWTRPVADEDGKPKRTSYTASVKRYHRRDQGGGLREEITYDVDGLDWEARVEIRTAAGVVVGKADAMVSRAESTWATRDDYALRSMAETRAESRAYRRACGWIVHMAGYSPTPAEEMGGGDAQAAQLPTWARPANDELMTAAKRWVVWLAGSENGDAKALWGRLLPPGDGAMPTVVALAICAIGKLVQDRYGADTQDKAAEAPDAPAPEPAPAADEFPPGTVYVNGEDAGAFERARFVTLDDARRLCQCPGGFDTAEKADAKELGARNDECPIRNHGIPF